MMGLLFFFWYVKEERSSNLDFQKYGRDIQFFLLNNDGDMGPQTVMEIRHAGISRTLENKHQSRQTLKLMDLGQTVM